MSNVKIPEDQSSAVILTDRHGGIRYLNEFGQLHREGDLPAEINHLGTFFYKNGALHRDNEPAFINSHQEIYFQNGIRHREGDLPAAIHFIKNKDGTKEVTAQEYYKKDILHRDNGPALIWSSGSYQHYNNGLLHNENGPACHYVENGKTVDEYWLKGVRVPKFAHTIIAMKDSVIRKHKIN